VFAVLAVAAALLGGCGEKEVKEPIKVALGPMFDAAKVEEQFGPLADYLGEKMEQPVEFTATKSVDEFGDLVKAGGYWFVFADPVTYFEVAEYCVPIAKPSYVGFGSMDQGSIIIKEGREKEIINVPEMKGSSIMMGWILTWTSTYGKRRVATRKRLSRPSRPAKSTTGWSLCGTRRPNRGKGRFTLPPLKGSPSKS
jgi:hypothetical protein